MLKSYAFNLPVWYRKPVTAIAPHACKYDTRFYRVIPKPPAFSVFIEYPRELPRLARARECEHEKNPRLLRAQVVACNDA
jgi:hypothetical protein